MCNGVKIGVLAAFSVMCAMTASAAGEVTQIHNGSAPSILFPGEVVVKTVKDIEQGQKNVKSVADELRTLFEPIKKKKKNTPTKDEVYLQIVPAEKGKASLVYRLRYAKSEKMASAIETLLSNDGYLEFAEEQNLVIIKDNAEIINSLAKALPLIDVASPQVLIEAKVIEVMFSDGMQRNMSFNVNQARTINTYDKDGKAAKTGVNNSAGFGTSSLAPAATSDGGKFNWIFSSGDKNFAASFQWLLNAQDAKVLSAPTIVVARNETSVISNGQDVPIQSQTNTNGSIQTSTTFKRVGVTLSVTPLMLNNDTVTLLVEPQVSNIQSYQTISQGDSSYQVPVISIRNIKTNVKLADGQIIVMGGLYNNRESLRQERIPFLSDMPYFGELFTSKYREKELLQLLFFLRVRVLSEDDLADGILFDPDENARVSNKIGDIMRNSPSIPKTQTTLQQIKEEFVEIKKPNSAEKSGAK